MNGSTWPADVLLAMIAAGLGMGLLLPAYTVAVQNSAPPKHMGIATATATFFRSIGSTVGVAIFGNILLTHYHHAMIVPPSIPKEAVAAFSNPLLLPQLHSQLETVSSHYENGPQLLATMYANVGSALLGGIQWIFLISAVLMVLLFILNLMIKDVPLSHGPHHSPDQGAPEIL
jgi:ABC-type siderophore export system fused ATPase/permease subunit